MRAILRACIRPVSVTLLAKDHNIEQTDSLNQIVEDLIKNEEIEGKFQSGSMFIPARFTKN